MIDRFRILYPEIWRTAAGDGSSAGWREYIQAAVHDFGEITRFLVAGSRPSSGVTFADHHRVTQEPGLNVNAEIGRVAENTVETRISLGLLFALDDLTHRVAANGDFFTFNPERLGQREWSGCGCWWLTRVAELLPTARFLDYSPVQGFGVRGGTYASLFFEVLPRDDVERTTLAMQLFNISLLWILMHEEAHYVEGHLSLLESAGEPPTSCGISELATMAVGGDFRLRRALEWQADRGATRAVLDVMFTRAQCAELPDYCGQNPRQWLLRLILAGIGIAIHIMQKARLFHGSSDQYPSPLTRLLGAFHIAVDHLGTPSQHRIWEPSPATWPGPWSTWEPAWLGALDDLNTVAGLMERDGLPEAEYSPGVPPLRARSMSHGLLEAPEDLETLAALLPYSAFGAETRERLMADADLRSSLASYDKWFAELDDIIGYHDSFLWATLEPHRRAVGNML